MTSCILIPIVVGLICAILGYLLGKMSRTEPAETIESLKEDLENCTIRSTQMKRDIETLRKDNRAIRATKNIINTQALSNQSPETTETTETTETKEVVMPFDDEAVLNIFGKKIKNNDLKIIEGIGPKIEELYNKDGIHTWKALSETSLDRLKLVLSNAGERYLIHDPRTWPKQARMAYEGRWQELKEWQSKLKGGKEV